MSLSCRTHCPLLAAFPGSWFWTEICPSSYVTEWLLGLVLHPISEFWFFLQGCLCGRIVLGMLYLCNSDWVGSVFKISSYGVPLVFRRRSSSCIHIPGLCFAFFAEVFSYRLILLVGTDTWLRMSADSETSAWDKGPRILMCKFWKIVLPYFQIFYAVCVVIVTFWGFYFSEQSLMI